MDAWMDAWMDGCMHPMHGCMTCDFTSISTVFQLHVYQDDGWMIMKSCAQNDNERPLIVEKMLPQVGLEPKTAKSVGQRLAH